MPKLKKIKVQKSKYSINESKSELPYSLPSMHVEEKQMSEVKDWEVGKTYQLIVEVKMNSKSESSNHAAASFEIVAYRDITEKAIDDMDDEEFEEYEKKASGRPKY